MKAEQDNWLSALGVTFDQALQKKSDAEASLTGSLQSAQDSALSAAGVSPETAQQIKATEQAIADFEKGREKGRASGSIGLLNILPPVQLVKAGLRIADADDKEAEALKIAGEKADTLAGIGKLATDPIGSGSAIGERLGKDAVQARKEGRVAEFTGNLAGHADVIAATVAVGGGGGALAEGGVVAAEGGVVAAEGGVIAAGEGGVVAAGEGGVVAAGEGGAVAAGEGGVVAAGEGGAVAAGEGGGGVVLRTAEGADGVASTARAPAIGEPVPSTQLPPDGVPPTPRSPESFGGDPISPAAESVPGSQVGKPVPVEGPPTQLPPPEEPIPPTLPSAELPSPAAESVPAPNVGEP